MNEDRQRKIEKIIKKELLRPEKQIVTKREKLIKVFTIFGAVMFLISSIASYGQLAGINSKENRNDTSALFHTKNEISANSATTIEETDDSKKKIANDQATIEKYKQVVKEDPKNTRALMTLANLLIETKQYNQSLDYIEKLILIEPSNVSAYKVKGSVLYLQERYDEALDVFSQVIKMDPNDDNLYKLMGDIALKQAKYEDAINYYQKSLEINDRDASVYQNIGVAEAKLNRLDDALKYYEKGLFLEPENKEILKNKQEILNSF